MIIIISYCNKDVIIEHNKTFLFFVFYKRDLFRHLQE